MNKDIKLLSEVMINRIAAGEVIERPASVIKELVENSIDAGSTNIKIEAEAGGRNLIIVSDNGIGIKKGQISIALTRHATSKLEGNNLLDIKSLGFRGEGLASICAVSRFKISSKYREADQGYMITVEGDQESDVIPSPISMGTKIEVRDLFYSTPARLKFLKSEATENSYINDIIKKLAMAHPNIGFTLIINGKETLSFAENDKLENRVVSIMGNDFADNYVQIKPDYNSEIHISGFTSIPTFNKRNSTSQYLFVNGRPVKDKILFAAIKVAYQDYLAKDRHPAAVIFVNLPCEEVDVNVHPTKAEIRFRDSQKVRSALISAIKLALAEADHRASTTTASSLIQNISGEKRGQQHNELGTPITAQKRPVNDQMFHVKHFSGRG